MIDKPTIVNHAVTNLFKPINTTRAVRRQLLAAVGTGLLVMGARTSRGPLRWFLWGWVADRLVVLAVVLWIGDDAINERARRLDAIGVEAREILTGEWP